MIHFWYFEIQRKQKISKYRLFEIFLMYYDDFPFGTTQKKTFLFDSFLIAKTKCEKPGIENASIQTIVIPITVLSWKNRAKSQHLTIHSNEFHQRNFNQTVFHHTRKAKSNTMQHFSLESKLKTEKNYVAGNDTCILNRLLSHFLLIYFLLYVYR